MAKKKHWYMKLEPGVIFADGGLCACSLEARGAWMWLLMRMHTNGATGVWEGTPKQLALQVSSIGHSVEDILDEWRANNVCDIDLLEGGLLRITNRKMERESELRRIDLGRKSENGPPSRPTPDSFHAL